jgi:hypothetical protein
MRGIAKMEVYKCVYRCGWLEMDIKQELRLMRDAGGGT